MSKIHMLDEAATARAKRLESALGYSPRQAWCGAIEVNRPSIEEPFSAHPDDWKDVDCPECIELVRLAVYAGTRG